MPRPGARCRSPRRRPAAPQSGARASRGSFPTASSASKVLQVPRGTRVIVLENDHTSPVLEWHARAQAGGFVVDTVKQPSDGDWTSAVLAAIERAGVPPVALASISS